MASKTRASKSSKRKESAVSASMQWAALTAVAVLAIVAVFVFGLGDTDGRNGGHSGAPVSITTN